MVLAQPEHVDDLQKLLNDGEWEGFIEFVTLKFIDMVESSYTHSAKFNKNPIKEEELKPMDIVCMLRNR